MFLTVTPDPVMDNIFFIEEWLPNSVMQTTKVVFSIGGKGLDASVALSHLNQQSTALCFLAGETGKKLSNLLQNYAIKLAPIWAEGETRKAIIISESVNQRHSHIFHGGITIQPHHLKNFLSQFHEELRNSNWVLTGGIFPNSLPNDLFRRLIHSSQQAGVNFLIDSHSKYVMPALSEEFEILKMNRREFEWTFDLIADSMDILIQHAKQIMHQYLFHNLVITCGSDGILAITPQAIIQSIPPKLDVINAAGAGDAASAALVWRLNHGDNWQDAIRWATAVSAAVVLTEGTAEFNYSSALNLIPDVIVQTIDQ
jgi:1-phosphofructokinase family hexose kinase